ncbi:AI-2E family transporter [Arachnia propionica]|uniref:AI-2E family transporter n=1 Tax=Arachnia propionica TaxID=1750 RepID=A0A3P1TDD9_9ACTN|nr:AI-2E family transporter [Arachnia propionica]
MVVPEQPGEASVRRRRRLFGRFSSRGETEKDAPAPEGEPTSWRSRARGHLGGLLGDAGRGARQLLTPTPEPHIAPVPPIIVNNDSPRLLSHSPFSFGFLGALGVLFAIALVGAAIRVQHVLVLVVLSLFLALGLNPAVEFFTRRRVPRPVAVFVVTIALLGLLVLGITAIVPVLTTQVQSLSLRAPYWLEMLNNNEQIAAWDREYEIIDKAKAYITSGVIVQNLFGGIWGAGVLLANLIFSLIITLVLTVYFLASLPLIKEVIYTMAPGSRRDRARYLANEIFRGISGYITGMFLIVTVASVSAYIFMNFVGLGAYSLALAFIVAMFCFIPLVGSSMAMIAVALVGFGTSSSTGIITIIYFLIYQQVDAYILYPTVMKRTVKVPGALVVLSAVIGGLLLGVIGALIAIPTAAAILLLYREVLQPHLDAS